MKKEETNEWTQNTCTFRLKDPKWWDQSELAAADANVNFAADEAIYVFFFYSAENWHPFHFSFIARAPPIDQRWKRRARRNSIKIHKIIDHFYAKH